jgi:hypothetical protein
MILISTVEVVLWGGGSGATPQSGEGGAAKAAIIPIALGASGPAYTAAGAHLEPRATGHCEENVS